MLLIYFFLIESPTRPEKFVRIIVFVKYPFFFALNALICRFRISFVIDNPKDRWMQRVHLRNPIPERARTRYLKPHITRNDQSENLARFFSWPSRSHNEYSIWQK